MPHPVYVIFQTTQHNTHTHALSIIYFLGHMSLWANVFLGKCLSGQTSSGQMSFRVNVLLGKRFLKVRFHHHILATNLLTNSLTKSPHKQMSDICVLFVSQKCVTNQIGLLQTLQGNFESKFVIKFVAKM
jgi:hypothetical protein